MTSLPAQTIEDSETTESGAGFGVSPSFFRANLALVEAGPAKVAERQAAEKRKDAFQKAVRFHRESLDALFRFKAMDATGQLAAGKEHYEVHADRAEDASDHLLDTAEDFIKGWKL